MVSRKKGDGQKYNFLVALLRQLEEADGEGDESAAEFRRWVCDAGEGGDLEQTLVAFDDRIGKCEQWIAALETRMDELESSDGEIDDQDPREPDDGDEDLDVERDEPPVERTGRGMPSHPRTVGPSSDRQKLGRDRVEKEGRSAEAIVRTSRRR